MRTGQLRHAVELQSAFRVSDSYGQSAFMWMTYATVKARIRPLVGNELMVASQVHERVSHRITLWHRDDVTTEHRILYGTREFAILAVLNANEVNEMLELTCVEKVT